MTIQLITQEQHATILNIYKNFPALTLQNTGYEKINKSLLSIKELEAVKEVEDLLEKHITGFNHFKNFKLRETGEICIRFNYDWNADEVNAKHSFSGVGYILIDELLNGFNNN
jgi:hypothetical protein